MRDDMAEVRSAQNWLTFFALLITAFSIGAVLYLDDRLDRIENKMEAADARP